ncbi:hypothetical protein AEM51_11785 [Bacteroidetes bacterium UKL13-3]|jgi:hypothetical protein|nr:hypothetical protein AEM51_11785 [Bacteroidetes bacterium UKL13-3]HCP93617.1 hypothetical protein [Bacteroidota bacterium]
MKQLFTYVIIGIAALSITVSSCKKKDIDENDDDTTIQTQQVSDESLFLNESENSLDEVNIAISGSTFGKTRTIAGATIVDSPLIKAVFITYNGLSGDGKRMRVGEVKIQLVTGNNWGEAGAKVRVTYSNLRITNIQTSKSITLNGFHLLTNVTGGRAFVDASVMHTIRGEMQLFFDNAASRNWQIARKRIVNYNNGNYDITISGDTTISGYTNIAVWGTNRNGNDFYTQLAQPIIFNSICLGKPVSGQKVHKKLAREITVTYGVDANGNVVIGTCPYGLKVNWINIRNVNKTVVISY